MKIVFQVIKTGSGNDVYFDSLYRCVKKAGLECRINYYSKYFQYAPWLLKFFKHKVNADVVHSSIEYGWVFKENGIKLYSSMLHNVLDPNYAKYTSFLQKIFHRLIIKFNTSKTLHISDALIAISKYTKKSYQNTYNITTNIHVIYCGIDTDTFKPENLRFKQKSKFKLFFVGNLLKRKGVDLLPKIMTKLGSNYELNFTTGLRSSIPTEFDLPNMKPLGKLSVQELAREYNRCDALLFPSRFEGFGYSVAEAMACGKPVITSNCSSLPELVTNNNNGFLCNVNDTSDFVKKIKSLSKNKSLQQKIGLNNSEKVKLMFSFKCLQSNYLKLISTI